MLIIARTTGVQTVVMNGDKVTHELMTIIYDKMCSEMLRVIYVSFCVYFCLCKALCFCLKSFTFVANICMSRLVLESKQINQQSIINWWHACIM